jgi:hypothetical protein
MGSAEIFCPTCGLSGCAAQVEGAETVSTAVLVQLRHALAVTALPEPPVRAALVAQARPLLLLTGDTSSPPELPPEAGLAVSTHVRAG